MTAATSILGLCFEPLDVLFFRDGRPFGAATRASSGLPMPQTLAGAIWTALLQRHGSEFSFGKLATEAKKLATNPSAADWTTAIERAGGPAWVARIVVRGPWIARMPAEMNQSPEALVPAPAVLHMTKKVASGNLHRLCPLREPPPGWRDSVPADQKDLRPLWLKHSDPSEPVTGFLTRRGLETFLAGDIPAPADLIKGDELFAFDHRTGIEISADQLTAKEGGIYGASFLALRTPYTARELGDDSPQSPAVVLYAEVKMPIDAGPNPFDGITTISLGGEGRRAKVTVVPRFDWPSVKPTVPKPRPLLFQTTPGIYDAGWMPACLRGRLVAAAMPGAVAVSGWDLARGSPKPTRFAAAAGSVYFLNELPNNLPEGLSDQAIDRQQGWGCFIQGAWNDE